ncbi:MAG: trypsin-like peptidase domain-containing protein [Pseudonocardiales bacterium]
MGLTEGVVPLDAPWRVRIRDADGVLGAGILVCGGQVLTCAHVISPEAGETPPHTMFIVEFVGVRNTPSAKARIAEGCWSPPRDHESSGEQGDVALLKLSGDSWKGLTAAPLRRLAVSQGLSGRQVRSCGFPDGAVNLSVWARAELAGSGAGGERVQLDSASERNPVTRGFSGAGVVDDETETVIGMVVSEYTERGVSWMLPVETILHYLPPRIENCVEGGLAVDRELSDRPGSQIDVDFARQITSWLSGRRRIRLIVTGDSESSRSAALRRVIRFADRESRPSADDRTIAEAAKGTVPPVGSIDLALDVSGKTVDEVSRRIADRLGIAIVEPTEVTSTLRAHASPMTLVVAGVDDVADPAALLTEVLAPLAERGVRLLLGFHHESSGALSIARSRWPDQDQPDDHPDVIRRRLDALATQVSDVADREDALGSYRKQVAARVAGLPELPALAASLRLRLSALRMADTDGERVWFLSQFDRCDAAVERALGKLNEFQRSLQEVLDRRRELGGRLSAFHAMAADHGLVEDTELDTVYRQAHEVLWPGPSDLKAAERLVDTYQRAVRSKIDGMR